MSAGTSRSEIYHRAESPVGHIFDQMMIWIPIFLSLGLIGACVRMWMEFSQRVRKLNSETEHTRSLVQSHNEVLAAAKAKVDEYKTENLTLQRERDDLEGEVQEMRQKLTALEERQERTHPANRRIDKSDGGEDLF